MVQKKLGKWAAKWLKDRLGKPGSIRSTRPSLSTSRKPQDSSCHQPKQALKGLALKLTVTVCYILDKLVQGAYVGTEDSQQFGHNICSFYFLFCLCHPVLSKFSLVIILFLKTNHTQILILILLLDLACRRIGQCIWSSFSRRSYSYHIRTKEDDLGAMFHCYAPIRNANVWYKGVVPNLPGPLIVILPNFSQHQDIKLRPWAHDNELLILALTIGCVGSSWLLLSAFSVPVDCRSWKMLIWVMSFACNLQWKASPLSTWT